MENADFIVKDFPHLDVADGLDGLFAPAFGPALNACVYPRRLTQDFNALARRLAGDLPEGRFLRQLDYDDLAGLRGELAHDAEREALDFILKDADALLDSHRPGFARLECRLLRANPFMTGQRAGSERFHADGEADDPFFENVLCTYTGRPTEFIAGAPGKGAEIHSFGLGNIWRFACRNSEATARPLIHRAPRVRMGEDPRLVLILTRSNRALWPEFEV